MKIYCCGCKAEIEARLTDGTEIYPHRPDLAKLPFWKCETCNNFVGCHHKTKQPTKPLVCIPTQEIKRARKHIHALLDPIWQHKFMPRGKLYAILSEKLGYPYHTAEVRSIEDAREVFRVVRDIQRGLGVIRSETRND